jgi:ABC-2 type transport system ATP-binding protein
VTSAAALREDLAALAAEEGVTIFLTTHNMSEAERLCSHVALIREGKLIAVDHPDRLRAEVGAARLEVTGSGFSPHLLERLGDRPEVSMAEVADGRLVIGIDDDAPAGPLVRLLVESGAEIDEVRRSAATLEDVFLALMGEQQ